jgi:hypothetical protein
MRSGCGFLAARLGMPCFTIVAARPDIKSGVVLETARMNEAELAEHVYEPGVQLEILRCFKMYAYCVWRCRYQGKTIDNFVL